MYMDIGYREGIGYEAFFGHVPKKENRFYVKCNFDCLINGKRNMLTTTIIKIASALVRNANPREKPIKIKFFVDLDF